MRRKAKTVVLSADVLLCAAIILMTAFMMNGWSVLVKCACYGISGVGIAFGVVCFALKKEMLLKSCFVVIACAFVIIGVVALMSKFGRLNDYKTDAEKVDRITEIIRNTGEWGMLVFVVLQILQVVVLPLPAVVCYVPGSMIWGALTATLLASLGVFIGSVICYVLGRVFGKRIVGWIAGKETTEKYMNILGKRGKVIFVLMQILPFFPDDILCMIAGLTSMNFFFFTGVIIIVRPLVIAVYCFLGSGSVIPFGGWGIAVWIAIFAVCIALAVLSLLYQDKFEKWLVGKVKRKKKNREEEED